MKVFIESYDQALDYIYSKIDFSYTKQQRYSPEVFDLDRMRKFMHILGDPQETYRTIHVAGTKGKGSTSAMIASILQAAGYCIGFYSSPHMVDYTERIVVDGEQIPRRDFISIVNRLYPLIEETYGLTTFEITTAIAFQYFKERKIDFGVIEVGLGGRLDATNIIKPEVSVIASISLDHMSILGDTLEAIAGEKAGIIKPGIPVVVSPQQKNVMDVFKSIAKKQKTQIFSSMEILNFNDRIVDTTTQRFTIHYPEIICENQHKTTLKTVQLEIPLLGKHQMENAGTAFCVIKLLQKKGLRIGDEAIREGFRTVKWQGRFEILHKNPFLVIDAAHNLDSSQRLVETIEEIFPEREITFIFGASEDKDIQGMLWNFSKISDLIIFTKSAHPRAAEPSLIRKQNLTLACDTIIIEDIQTALEYAFDNAKKEDVIVASGSVFIAAAIREIWFSTLKEKSLNE